MLAIRSNHKAVIVLTVLTASKKEKEKKYTLCLVQVRGRGFWKRLNKVQIKEIPAWKKSINQRQTNAEALDISHIKPERVAVHSTSF